MFRRLFTIAVAAAMLLACTRDEIPQKELTVHDKPQRAAIPESGRDMVDFCVVVDGKEYYAIDAEGTDLSIFVPEGTKLNKLVAKFRHNAASVTVNGVEQVSGKTVNNFSNFVQGVDYRVEAPNGKGRDYYVRVLDTRLPVVSVRTATSGNITSKKVWRDASIKIQNPDGTITMLGATGIRGRGNWTWQYYPKKPYALKLDSRKPVLGMPAHKKWVLLALWQGFIGNAMAFEATRRAPSMEWAPRAEFVEMVLNGKFQGLYYLTEQIKKDENRMDIAELKPEDVSYPAVSGGYLLEYDQLYDEKYQFKSSGFDLPVLLKSPKDTVPDAQFNYIRKYINDMEAEILKIGTGQESHYADYLDINSFADYWMVLESVNNYEAWKPRSVKMSKGRDGVDSPVGTVSKLKAGPLWDQEWFLEDKEFNSMDMYYYHYLFQDPVFVQTVKERWKVYRSNILGNGSYPSLVEYMDGFVSQITYSADRDVAFWGNSSRGEYGDLTIGFEANRVHQKFVDKINWMDSQIQGF